MNAILINQYNYWNSQAVYYRNIGNRILMRVNALRAQKRLLWITEGYNPLSPAQKRVESKLLAYDAR